MNKKELESLIESCERAIEKAIVDLSSVVDEHGIPVAPFEHKSMVDEFNKIINAVRESHSCSGYSLRAAKACIK